jgi:hypothetical protein
LFLPREGNISLNICQNKVLMNGSFNLPLYMEISAIIIGVFSILITAFAKAVFEHIEPLKPRPFLLGDTIPLLQKCQTKVS